LPKSGTGSIAGFLSCGGIKTAHYRVKPRQPHPLLGECAESNIKSGNNNTQVWEGCGNYQAFSNTEYLLFEEPYNCFIPSIQALDAMYQHYPNSTILLGIRNDTEAWYNSFHNWYDGRLENAWRHCNAPGLPGVNATAKDFVEFYEWHTQHIRTFAANHPSMTYIEIVMEDKNAGDILERELGISAKKCWRHLHKSKRR
jgi:hypothetical protein